MTDSTIIETATAKGKNPKSGKKNKSETPREKFLRLAPPRMEVALKKISLVGNLAGSGYQYDPSEAKDIVEALDHAVQEVSNKFNKGKRGGKGFAFRSK